METTRQKKVAGILQKDLAVLLLKLLKNSGKNNILSSVTKVKISPDLSIAKIYVSVFPVLEASNILSLINKNKGSVKKSLAELIKNQVRRIPDLVFYHDDSLDHIDKVESALKGVEDPIQNSSLLNKRKSI
ncbi:MAG: ribosome-binding factor A [Flavobacteriaceae bacterium]|nr:ribosome-binding factor A [Flavobacteriaceae bacterium]|tara:strand:- start:4483 stop:4875 length:393 start_codon:yes stop_codon:yes gene_type:complete